MNRRHFLRDLPALFLLITEVRNVVGKSLPRILLPLQKFLSITTLRVFLEDGSESIPIPIHWRFHIAYVSAFKLAGALAYHTYFNEQRRKIVIYLPHNKVLITADNPFLLIDGKTYQMPAPAIWLNSEIFVPLQYFVPLINRNTNLKLDYQPSPQVLRVSQKDFNVAGIRIEKKENGTVIRIRTSRRFKPREMTMDMRYGWLHVDLFGCKGDLVLLKKTVPKGLVRKVKVYQFDQLLSIAFQLRREPLSKQIYQDRFTNEVVVVLQTKESLTEADESNPGNEGSVNNEMQSQLEEEKKRWLIDTVVIDAGHGGKDPGAIGLKNVYEKDVVLAIALKLGEMVEKRMPGVKVIYTRKKDIFVPLRRRTQIANENNGKVFISIHANWSKKKGTNGFESYILGPEKGEYAREVVLKENSVIRFEDPGSQKEYEGINMILATMAQSAFMRQSEHLASMVQQELGNRLRSLNLKNRGVKQAPFWVMVGASMPSILVETGFITNPYEARILKTARYQQKIAEGIFSGLQRFKIDYENAI